MTKSKFMRVAAVLMAAVLLTTCAISGTFAKYVTTGAGTTSSARVAKWGVAITASGSDAFATTYAKDDNGAISANTVITNPDGDGAKLVAPGTSGTAVSVGITGTPEVEVAVTYEATITATGWSVGAPAAEYFPIVFTVGGETYGITGIKDSNGDVVDHGSATIAALITAVEAAIEGAGAHYAPNTDLATATNADMTITWEWAFTGNDDAKDTALGDLVAAPTISIATTATVTQVD